MCGIQNLHWIIFWAVCVCVRAYICIHTACVLAETGSLIIPIFFLHGCPQPFWLLNGLLSMAPVTTCAPRLITIF